MSTIAKSSKQIATNPAALCTHEQVGGDFQGWLEDDPDQQLAAVFSYNVVPGKALQVVALKNGTHLKTQSGQAINITTNG